MIIQKFIVGELQANCYLIGCESTHQGAVIDPGGDADLILRAIEESQLEVGLIINTHGHFDHFAANGPVKEATGADFLIHNADAHLLNSAEVNLSSFFLRPIVSPPADRFIEDGDGIALGEVRLQVRHTPGHSPGGVCLVGTEFVFTGDTLFRGSLGRTDFPDGSHNVLLRSIRTQLLTLGDDVVVYPGHGDESTIGLERHHNPFL